MELPVNQSTTPALQVLQRYSELLHEEGVAFEVGEDSNLLMLLGETSAGRCEGYLIVDDVEAIREEDDDIVHLIFTEIFYLLPIEQIPEERLPALMELILRLNESHRIGAWELHIEDQEIRFRIYQTLVAEPEASAAQLLMPLYEGVRAIDLHWSSFQMVLEQDMDPAHAIAEFYAREALEDDEEEGPDEELIARAGQLFALARARYQRGNHESHARLINQRLEDLTRKTGQSLLKFGRRAASGWDLDN